MTTTVARKHRRQVLREKARKGDLSASAQLNERKTEIALVGRRPDLERKYATRALAVLAYIDLVMETPRSPIQQKKIRKAQEIANRRGAMPVSRRPGQNRREFKRSSWFRPDRDEKGVRDIAARWRQRRMERKDRGDGDISGLLAVASELAAEEVSVRLPGFADEESQAALAQWFYGMWGEGIHRFYPGLSPSDFYEDMPNLGKFPSYIDYRARIPRGK